MYIDNKKISCRQMKRLIIFNILSLSWLIIPRISVASAGRDGIISIIIGLFLGLIYVFYIDFITNKTQGNIIKYSKEMCGGFVTFLLGAFYIVKFFISFVFCGRLFAGVIKETLLEDTKVSFIILMLIILSAYSASKGFEVRARTSELLYFIVLISMGIFLILGLKSVNQANLLPLFTEAPSNILYGAYLVFITFSTLEFFLFSMELINKDLVAEKKQRKYFTNKTLNSKVNALLIVGLIYILLYVVTLGILGPNDTSNKLWSTINMVQLVDLPGSFLQRHDALIISIWMLSIFTLTSGFLYYLLIISKQVYKFSSKNYILFPFALLLFAACILPIDTEIFYYYFERYMVLVAMPGTILLPVLVLLIGGGRKHRNHRKEIKRKVKVPLLIALIPIVALTACSDMTEIEDRNFVQAIGVDYKNGEISFSLASPDLGSYTDQGGMDEDGKEIKQRINFKEIKNKPYLTLGIYGSGDLEKGLEVNKEGFDRSYKIKLDEINLICNLYIKDQIVRLIEEITKEEKVDFLNLYGHIYTNKTLWLRYRDRQEDFLDDLNYEVEVDIGL